MYLSDVYVTLTYNIASYIIIYYLNGHYCFTILFAGRYTEDLFFYNSSSFCLFSCYNIIKLLRHLSNDQMSILSFLYT